MLKVSPWKVVVRFGKPGKLNPRYVGHFKVLEKVGEVTYKLELPEEMSKVHNTFHVSNLKKCYADEPLAVPLDGLHFDDKLHFVEEPVEIVDREVKRLKRSRIPLVKLHEQTLNLPKNNAPALHAIRAGKVQKGKKHKKPQPQMAARGQNQGNGKNKHAYAPKPKIPPPPKREDHAKDSICHECGETGHWKRNCPQYLAELLKKKKNAASGAGGSGIFAIELNTFLNRSWIYDTGCGTHICNTTQGLRASRKLKPGALSLYVGNGQREAIEAIGNFDFSLPSGLVIVLNNYHYAPSITRCRFPI
ncbi:zinc finger, CCHC-type containing protein [Tanacetum coccineum]